MLRLDALADEVKMGALDCERLALEEDRREAASSAGLDLGSSCCQSEISGIESSAGRDRERDCEVDALSHCSSRSSSDSPWVASSPSAPQPTPHAISSTMAMVHLFEIWRSRQPFKIRSAPRPISVGTSYSPKASKQLHYEKKGNEKTIYRLVFSFEGEAQMNPKRANAPLAKCKA